MRKFLINYFGLLGIYAFSFILIGLLLNISWTTYMQISFCILLPIIPAYDLTRKNLLQKAEKRSNL